jgi:hypothetical protein
MIDYYSQSWVKLSPSDPLSFGRQRRPPIAYEILARLGDWAVLPNCRIKDQRSDLLGISPNHGLSA